MIFETKKAIRNGEKIVLAPIQKLRANYVEMQEIRKIDTNLRTFININTPEEMDIINKNV